MWKRLLVALLLRLALVFYGEWHDAHLGQGQLAYTDVDYRVFSDAAHFVTQYRSPYERATYRYTPLLAWLLTPNTWCHPVWGKLIFVVADMGVALLLSAFPLVSLLGPIWLFNPFVMNISSRGNAESLLACIVLATLYAFERARQSKSVSLLTLAALCFGLCVHFKVYPIIYAPSFLLALSGAQWWRINRRHVLFGSVSACSFFVLGACMYSLYGHAFIEHTFLYHLGRSDHRHNFSPYFYPLYLTAQAPHQSTAILHSVAKWAFLPQAAVVFAIAFRFARVDLPFALFLQTFAFVTFNKVCTSQYFMWYLCFVPLAVPQIKWSRLKAWLMISLWAAAQAIYLYFAYQFEILGRHVYRALYGSGAVFFLVNVLIMKECITGHISNRH